MGEAGIGDGSGSVVVWCERRGYGDGIENVGDAGVGDGSGPVVV